MRTFWCCIALLAVTGCDTSHTVVGNNADEIRFYREHREHAQRYRDAVVNSMNQSTALMVKMVSAPESFSAGDAATLKVALENVRLASETVEMFGKPMSEPLGTCGMLGSAALSAIDETIRSASEPELTTAAEKKIKAYQITIGDCDRQLKSEPQAQVFIQTRAGDAAPKESCEPELLKQVAEGKALWRCREVSSTTS
ncbi:hypothetical protein PIN31009_04990 [Pandoraea iniqua]|nr:hypothetical protein PIN31009_04990 [Pandoraea iniqua]